MSRVGLENDNHELVVKRLEERSKKELMESLVQLSIVASNTPRKELIDVESRVGEEVRSSVGTSADRDLGD